MNFFKEHTDYADFMEEESNGFESAYHLFIQTVSNHSFNEDNAIPCFFEGQDDISYYPLRIRKIIEYKDIEKTHVSIDCNGRKNVLKMLIKLLSDGSPFVNKSLFFVDKDFYYENNLPEQIYVTPVNAIENFYASEKVLDNFLENYSNVSFYGMDIKLLDYTIIKQYFKRELDTMLEDFSPLSAWYSLQMNFDHDNLQEKPTMKIISSLSKVNKILERDRTREINLEFLENNTLNFRNVSQEKLSKEIEMIKEDLIANTRGKYIEEMLIIVYQKIITESKLRGRNSIGLNDFKVKSMHLDSNSFKSTLTICADTPKCLNDYLTSRIH